MNYYMVWVDLAPGVRDLEFTDAVNAFATGLVNEGRMESFSITRRKFGFGPAELGEFEIRMAFKDLAQLDYAFSRVAVRDAEIERVHAAVYGKVVNFKSALYRDFPDEVRAR